MATGTGKTLLSAAICKLFLRNSIAKRVLFLVDRIELEKQAEEAFSSYFKKEYEIQVFKNKKKNWEIVGIDPDGFDLRKGKNLARLFFEKQLNDAKKLRGVFVNLHNQASRV